MQIRQIIRDPSTRFCPLHLIIPIIIALLLSACGSQAPDTEEPVSPIMPESPLSGGSLEKPDGKLTPRLQILAEEPGASAETLGLPAEGPGSLMRNDRGAILVYIRLNDTSEATLETLQTIDSLEVVDVTEEAQIVTAYIQPEQLLALVDLPTVQTIQEEVNPQ